MLKYFFATTICLCCMYANQLQAQLCTGSLGDPVVNITFGTVSQPLTSRQTSYRFDQDCPDDGEYTIASAVPQCHAADNSWHPLREDHTPNDINGMMMIINASQDPGDFYVDTVRGLCSNTTYEFASWIMNILATGSFCYANGTIPNITFSIENTDGSLIAKYNTGDIKATAFAQWQQFGFFFTNSNNSDIVLRLTNNGPGGCGNDLALDDITFRPCGPAVTAFIKGDNNSADSNICQGTAANLVLESTVSAEYTNPAYQWQQSSNNGTTWTDIAGATSLSLPINIAANAQVASTQYRLSVGKTSNINTVQCRIASNVVSISINEKPSPDITTNNPFCEGKDIILSAHKGTAFNWAGPDNFSSTDSTIVLADANSRYDGVYSVDITSAAGCSITASTRVLVNKSPVAAVSNDVSICEGSSTQLQGSGGFIYQWIPATGLSNAAIANPVASPADSTNYTLIVTNEKGCTDTAFTKVFVWKKPIANAGPNKQIMEGDTVVLEGTASGTNITYNWTPNINLTTAQLLQPIAAPTQNTTYTLHIQSLQGCGIAIDEVFVRVFKKVDIPNAFSPNGDGINDKWILKNIETYPEADITVFNRYGQLLYKAKGNGRPWNGTYNGTPLPVASYYYVIDLKSNFPKLSGWIMLLR
ncbi:gliding motility-associated C-terminal domain-containing protein [Ilyomonas limi]|uniref:Gliding motility-associated C-terminal domain-containing protein n=1 Tax=Ilyomonas limi TaxID=2575867 RepID=A0A4U3L241_9BACT|nr:gliding motility-associated C-terminal domain-containing protein [Ilyomonas limi]TKK68299.1 gliding motility-associated C-terminal domain-containing protein [Ilyomonas limi]